jgi:hypothetical protein
LIYRFLLNNTTELDSVSHFFGGISVTIALQQIFTYLNSSTSVWGIEYVLDAKSTVILLFLCIIGFEFLEYITGQYPYSTPSLLQGVESKLDTLIDISSGLLGGICYLTHRRKGKSTSKI